MDKFSMLAQNTVFSALKPDKLIRIQDRAISRTLNKGEFVTYQDDVWPYLLFIKSGEFNAQKESGQGRSFVIKTFSPGDIFWGLALFENEKPNPMGIRTASEGEIFLWHKDQVEEIIVSDPQIAWELFSLLAKTMERAGEIVEELAFRPLTGRLANLLLDLNKGLEDDFVSRDLTLDEMAARIGSTREMVCKIMYQFSDQGILEIHRTEFKINDRDELKDIANKMKG